MSCRKARKCKVCGARLSRYNKHDCCFVHQQNDRTVYFYVSDVYCQLFLDEEDYRHFQELNKEDCARVVPVVIPGGSLLLLMEIEKHLIRKEKGDRLKATDFLSLIACLAVDYARAEKGEGKK